jgi:ribonucleotide reductase alpha subunit
MNNNITKNANVILEKRYLGQNEEGQIIETPTGMFERVATNIASAELLYDKTYADVNDAAAEFFDVMSSLKFLPNSPTLMNAGKPLQMCSACFVLPVYDSIEEIFDAVKNAAVIHRSGGGTGFDFSRIRPENSSVKSTNGMASGPISFLKVFNSATDVIKQGGKRRGASMAVLRCDHPDIVKFIQAKQKDGEFSNFNFSVGITDKFMQAYMNDEYYDLIDPHTNKIVQQISAKYILELIAEYAHKNGEPGMIFIDTMNKHNPVPLFDIIRATNPCVTGDTLVAMADGRGYLPIKQLAEENKDVPVYTRKDNGKIAVRTMRNPRVTGYNVPVFKVVLDSGDSVRVTENHKFVMSDGSVKETKDLVAGDSLSIMTKRQAPFEEIVKSSNSKSQDYLWVNTTDSKNFQPEHRLIANHYFKQLNGSSFGFKKVVHHKDHNGLNNLPENLEAMLKTEHDALHGENMIGENNPMNRFPEKNWMNDPEKQTVARLKNHIGKKRSAETCKNISESIKDRNTEEYRAQASATAIKAYKENKESYDVGFKKRAEEKLADCQSKTDLKCYLNSNSVMVEKTCERCGAGFNISWSQREVSFCSHECALAFVNSNDEVSKKRVAGLHNKYESKMANKTLDQVHVYLDLKSALNREPLREEWENECSIRKISKRLGGRFSHKNYGELKKAAGYHNHRVVSVVADGLADVYNGTVDEFHNFYIGKFEEANGSKPCYHSLCNLQCGEQPLYDYESCTLGSINLAKFVDETGFNWTDFARTIRIAIHFLDNVLDMNKYPIPAIEEKTKKCRKVGLGVMGFHDMLLKLGIRYDSQECLNMIDEIGSYMNEVGIVESQRLAKERGPFSEFSQSIFKDEAPRRNATLFSIAPTGTISIIGNCSSSIEPIFAYTITRNHDLTDGQLLIDVNNTFEDILKERGCYSKELLEKVSVHGSCQHIDGLPEDLKNIFVSAHDIPPEWHIRVQAQWQKYVDAAISKTCNLPYEAEVQDVIDAYMQAYNSGCKGVTVYRNGSRENQVLNAGTTENKEAVEGSQITFKEVIPEYIEPGTLFDHTCPSCGEVFQVAYGTCAWCPKCGQKECGS